MQEVEVIHLSVFTYIDRLARCGGPNPARAVAIYETFAAQASPGAADLPAAPEIAAPEFAATTLSVTAELHYCGALLSLIHSARQISRATRSRIAVQLAECAVAHSAAAWWAPRLTARALTCLLNPRAA